MSHDHIAAIHVLKARLRLSDDDYRALLRQLTGNASSKDCSPAQRQQVREHLQRLAERMGVAKPRASSAASEARRAAARPLERKVWALWNALGRAGKLDAPTPAGLQAWVKRQTGLDHLRFCNDWQLHGLIESLKLWQERAAGPSQGVGAIHESPLRGQRTTRSGGAWGPDSRAPLLASIPIHRP